MFSVANFWFTQMKGYIREPLILKANTLPLDQSTEMVVKMIGPSNNCVKTATQCAIEIGLKHF